MPWADLTDTKIYYELTGQGDPVLMVPGLGCTAEMWSPLVTDLSRHFLLVRVDNRGLGRSKAKRTARNISHLSADLAELLNHLQLERVHVIGVSLGGMIAQRFAMEHSEKVERLVLLSCAHCFTPYLWEMARFMWRALTRLSRRQYLRAFELLTAGPEYLDADPGQFERSVTAACNRRVPRAALMRQLRALYASRVDSDAFQISCPTLVMSGECDHLIPAYYARRMAAEIRDCKCVVIPGVGHSLLNECPQEVLREVIAFLGSGPEKTRPERPDKLILSKRVVVPGRGTSAVRRSGALS